MTSSAIFDVTTSGSGYSAALTFATSDANSGRGIWTNFVLDNGAHYVFYADETNGLHQYSAGGSWSVTGTGITGPSGGSGTFVFVMQHKGRLWFVERNSARAWYLAAGAVSGTATRFDFGNKFSHGGHLIGLWNWTLDGGDGPDDYLVAIGSGGDVIVYAGTDPASASTWQVVGQYYIGQLPAGRRIACLSGGELFVLSQYGVLPMSRVLQGRTTNDPDIYASRNISPLILADMATLRNQIGWELRNVPNESALLIATPKVFGFPYKQYVMSHKTSGWSIFTGVEHVCGETYRGEYYTGGESARVYRLTGTMDDVALDGSGGNEISWVVIPAFSDLGEPGLYHRVHFARPVFTVSGPPSYTVVIKYDYDTDEPTALLPTGTALAGAWDVGLWDSAVWGADRVRTQRVIGTNGLGRAVSPVLIGRSRAVVELIRTDVIYDTGGFL
ncbi:MAG: hypothetical protein NZ534_00035 [Bacteroidia bacterium]|nr:hypothetical protein [Bacteroidia bacterium]